MTIITSPEKLEWNSSNISIFLAGSIEQGKATNWQKQIIEKSQSWSNDIVILNPRRHIWDNSWPQSKIFPQFYEQVTWELQSMERANIIVMWFEGGTLSPITLLECGLHAKSKKLVVGCDPNFWRVGNVEITCEYYGVPFYSSIDELCSYTKCRIASIQEQSL